MECTMDPLVFLETVIFYIWTTSKRDLFDFADVAFVVLMGNWLSSLVDSVLVLGLLELHLHFKLSSQREWVECR